MPLTAVLALLATPAAPFQEPPTGCRRCDHRGVLECTRHPKDLRALEREVRYCSVAATCPDCGGTLLVDCPRCDGGPDSALRERRLAEIAACRDRPDRVEKHLGRSLLRAETANFALIVDVPAIRVQRRKMDGHRYLHLLLHDLEHVATLLHGHFQAGPGDHRTRQRMWFWAREADHRSVMLKFLFNASSGDFKFLGRDPIFSVWTGDGVFANDGDKLHALAVHNGAHMLLSNLFRELWIGDLKGGWFDAGVAHWYEEEVFGRSVNYCIDESSVPPDYHGGVWRPVLYKRLRREKQALLPVLLNQLTGTLTPEQHALAWSLYDWLVHEHAETLRAFLQGFQQKRHSRELFRDLLDMDVRQVEEAWRAWVDEAYRPRSGRRRGGRG